MFDSKTKLLDKIRLGESSFLEFKELQFAGGKIKGPHRNSLADGLAAFANGHGGVFFLGVSDKTREIAGIPVEHLDAVVEFIRNVCMNSIEPPLEQVTLDRLRLPSPEGEEVTVVKIDVPRSAFVHRSPGGYLHLATPSTVPKFGCVCSRTDLNSTRRAPSPTRSPSRASATGSPLATMPFAACWRGAPSLTNRGWPRPGDT